jgi:hypothetical protein
MTTDSSQIETSSFPLHKCDGLTVKIYRSNKDAIFRLGKFIVQVTESDVLQLEEAPEGVEFEKNGVVCEVQDVVKVCKENPRGPNHYAFSLNLDRVGIKAFYTFNTPTFMVLSIKKIVKDNTTSIDLEWGKVDEEKEKLAKQAAAFCSDLMI